MLKIRSAAASAVVFHCRRSVVPKLSISTEPSINVIGTLESFTGDDNSDVSKHWAEGATAGYCRWIRLKRIATYLVLDNFLHETAFELTIGVHVFKQSDHRI